jgi:hypothetical protein
MAMLKGDRVRYSAYGIKALRPRDPEREGVVVATPKPRRGAERENFWLQHYRAQNMADLNTARVTPVRQRKLA